MATLLFSFISSLILGGGTIKILLLCCSLASSLIQCIFIYFELVVPMGWEVGLKMGVTLEE